MAWYWESRVCEILSAWNDFNWNDGIFDAHWVDHWHATACLACSNSRNRRLLLLSKYCLESAMQNERSRYTQTKLLIDCSLTTSTWRHVHSSLLVYLDNGGQCVCWYMASLSISTPERYIIGFMGCATCAHFRVCILETCCRRRCRQSQVLGSNPPGDWYTMCKSCINRRSARTQQENIALGTSENWSRLWYILLAAQ